VEHTVALALIHPKRTVPAVDRAARLLDILARQDADWSLTELAQELGVHKGTTRDILLTLQEHALVDRDAASNRYRLGLGAARFARAALKRVGFRDLARPTIERLVSDTGETVLLGARTEQHVVIVDVVEPSHDLHPSASIGQRLPLSAGSFGKAFLAEPRAFETFLERGGVLAGYTELTQTDPDVYAAELAVVRMRGFALDNEEYLEGVRAASALVRGSGGQPLGGITFVGFRTRVPLDRLEELGMACRDAADEVATRIGFTDD
jgi:IclR family acetate operon transcriptional repressor